MKKISAFSSLRTIYLIIDEAEMRKTSKENPQFKKINFQTEYHSKFRFIPSTGSTFKQIEQFLQYTCRLYKVKREKTLNELAPSR